MPAGYVCGRWQVNVIFALFQRKDLLKITTPFDHSCCRPCVHKQDAYDGKKYLSDQLAGLIVVQLQKMLRDQNKSGVVIMDSLFCSRLSGDGWEDRARKMAQSEMAKRTKNGLTGFVVFWPLLDNIGVECTRGTAITVFFSVGVIQTLV